MILALNSEKTRSNHKEDLQVKDSFFIRTNHMLSKVGFSEIQWIHSEGNYCFIHTAARKFALKMSLKKLSEKLQSNQFLRIHKSFIVRIDCIDKIDVSEHAVIVGKHTLPLGKVYKEFLLKRLEVL